MTDGGERLNVRLNVELNFRVCMLLKDAVKSGRGRLQEVVQTIVIWLGKVWYFEEVVAYKRWCLRKVVARGGSTV